MLITPLLIVFSLCPASISSIPGVQRQKMMSMLNQNRTCRKKDWRNKLLFFCLSRCMPPVQVQGGGPPPAPTTLHPRSASWPPHGLFPFLHLHPPQPQCQADGGYRPPPPSPARGLESLVTHDIGEEGTQRGVNPGLSRLTSGLWPPSLPACARCTHRSVWLPQP